MQARTKKWVGMILVGSMLLGVFAACGKQPEGSQQSQTAQAEQAAAADMKNSLVIATESEPPTLHPFDHKAVTAGYMNLLTFNALMKIDPQTLEPELDLAESYETASDTEWTFTLKDGVLFQDGSTLDAQDVVASMEYAKTFPTTADYTLFWADVQAVDGQTVKITTDGPYAMVLDDLANIDILPSELIDAGNDFSENPVGTGPYCFVEWNRGDSIVFEKNDQYFDQAHQPSIQQLTWRIILEGASRTIALQAGEVDFVMEVEATDLARLQEDEQIEVQQAEGTRLNFMAMNSEAGPFGNQDFRRAVNAAVDRDAVVTVACNGAGIPAIAHTSPAFEGSSEENAQGYDLEKAKEYLEKSGVDPEEVHFSCLVSNDVARRTAEVIQANLAELGIAMEIESMDYATHLNAIMSGDFETAISGYTSSYLYSFVSGLYHSDAIDAANLARLNDPTVDQLIEAAKVELDKPKQTEIFQELSAYLNEKSPFVPLYQTMVVKAYGKDLTGVTVGKNGNVRFEDVKWAQ